MSAVELLVLVILIIILMGGGIHLGFASAHLLTVLIAVLVIVAIIYYLRRIPRV